MNKPKFYYRGVFSDQTLEELGNKLIDSIKVNFRARKISITNEQLKMIFEQSLNDIVRMADSYNEKRVLNKDE